MSTKRIEIKKVGHIWGVTCEVCADHNFLNFYPWIGAQNHATAIVLARWHIDEHQRRTCEHCHRTDELPRPQHIDAAHVNFEGRLYEIRASGVIAIGTAA